MRLVQVARFGGHEALVNGERPDPVAGRGEVVVGVSAADVLFLDTMIRSGRAADYFPTRPPYVPGNGVGGQVVSVGAGVDPDWLGRRVVAHTGGFGGGDGYAEQAVVSVDELVPIPDELGIPEATALLHDGMTAFTLADRTGIHPGESVLIVGAGGGLGILLVQLAHAAGTYVVAAARGAKKLDLARELGADAAIDYSDPSWTEQVVKHTGGVGPDVIFDGVGGQLGRAAFEIAAAGGRFSAHGSTGGGFTVIEPREAEERAITVWGIEQVQLQPAERRQYTTQVLAAAAAGDVRPVIGQTYPLERAGDAHAAIEARSVIGKTLLVVISARPTLGVNDEAVREATEAVARFVEELQTGIDRHDADMYNRHFAADVMWGSPFGATLQGYDLLHAIHARMQEQGRGGPSSRYEIDQVLVPAADVAIAHVRRVALDPAGRPIEPTSDLTGSFSEMALYILIRRDGTWWLAAGQNTPVRPPPTSAVA